MLVVNNFLLAVAKILDIVLNLYMWAFIISALLSWVNPDPYNPIVRFLRSITEPVLLPIRKKLGIWGGIDFSPIVAILVIIFLQTFLVATLRQLAYPH